MCGDGAGSRGDDESDTQCAREHIKTDGSPKHVKREGVSKSMWLKVSVSYGHAISNRQENVMQTSSDSMSCVSIHSPLSLTVTFWVVGHKGKSFQFKRHNSRFVYETPRHASSEYHMTSRRALETSFDRHNDV
ncbi:hypothetical protein EVAR_63901_1 [Eumeta japonica]|uniref:Uncharacterized protein n=1 Tax=Eumeta variegata TaxID=151549 RepID=A0A4C1ZPP9_EUMVA|nr:hypothetical protein EVAR_63901_1 [Eumeta japonica]